MSYLDLSITAMHQAIIDGKVTPLELTKEAISRAKVDTCNAFERIMEKEAMDAVNALNEKDKENPLWGIPFVIKDNFSTKGVETTGSSNILNGYVPVFDSEVYARLIRAGGIPIAKATLDELAMGGTGTTGHKGTTFNPWDPTHAHEIGGSSCGSAAAVSSSVVPYSIGSDTGDSVRKPASHAGLVGFKPSWGRISRYGLFPFATSLDHVGYFTRNVKDSAILLETLAGRDDKDASSSFRPVEKYSQFSTSVTGKKIAVIEEIYKSVTDPVIRAAFEKTLDGLKKAGAIVGFVSMNEQLLRAIYPTYIVISCAESTSNNANLDGIKFGPRPTGENYEEIMTKARTAGFSELIKRRFVIGSYSLLRDNQYDTFLRAQKCRRLIVNEVNRIFEQYDAIYLPASPTPAPLFAGRSDKLSNQYLEADNHLAIGNFGGFPSITLPIGFENGLPFGGSITCRPFAESETFTIAQAVENVTGLAGITAEGGRK